MYVCVYNVTYTATYTHKGVYVYINTVGLQYSQGFCSWNPYGCQNLWMLD